MSRTKTDASKAGTATLIRTRLPRFAGHVNLYQVDPPVEFEGHRSKYVVVSAVAAPYAGPETYIFPASKDGKVIDWGELDGSFRGAMDHVAALEGAGYEVKP